MRVQGYNIHKTVDKDPIWLFISCSFIHTLTYNFLSLAYKLKAVTLS